MVSFKVLPLTTPGSVSGPQNTLELSTLSLPLLTLCSSRCGRVGTQAQTKCSVGTAQPGGFSRRSWLCGLLTLTREAVRSWGHPDLHPTHLSLAVSAPHLPEATGQSYGLSFTHGISRNSLKDLGLAVGREQPRPPFYLIPPCGILKSPVLWSLNPYFTAHRKLSQPLNNLAQI